MPGFLSQEPIHAVIPTLVLVGPLALLAALLPALFGGLALRVRRWLVLLSVACFHSTVYVLSSWFGGYLSDSWWGSPMALWSVLAGVTLAGIFWSWRRQRVAFRANPDGTTILPQRLEVILLGTFFIVCVGQGVTTLPRQTTDAVQVVWVFEPPERGAIISSPLVEGDHVYVAAIHDTGLSTHGAVYCLEHTRKVVWKFDNDGTMQHMYSSPCIADGRLYIGEGMHANYVCKFYCLDAASGRKLWHFETAGHIESSPCVAAGKVFFGAGDDGIYCLDAVTGRPRWHFQGPFHVDTSPAVAGKCLYAGSGISRRYKATEIFGLDIEDGRVLWRTPTDLPVWGSPVVDGDQIFFGLGNGRLIRSAEPPEQPAGALLCVGARTGQPLWRYAVGDGILSKPAVDRDRVYFGARDGCCYCLDRHQGRLLWQQDLGSPVVTRPALLDPHLYVLASGGRVACLDAASGRIRWSFDVAAHSQTKPRLFSSPAVRREHEDGIPQDRIYFGAELQNSISSAAALYCLRE